MPDLYLMDRQELEELARRLFLDAEAGEGSRARCDRWLWRIGLELERRRKAGR